MKTSPGRVSSTRQSPRSRALGSLVGRETRGHRGIAEAREPDRQSRGGRPQAPSLFLGSLGTASAPTERIR